MKRFLIDPYCIKIILSCFLLLTAWPIGVHATEEYAEQTGRSCEYCHLDPSGGGELTTEGREYNERLVQSREVNAKPETPLWNRLFRLTIGYLHLVVGILWFGTILYVHLVLKPAYAARGLPKGEVKIGLFSMAVMAATGGVLTYYRVPSLPFLFETRFGILLLVKIGLFSIMVLCALIAVFYVGPRLKQRNKESVDVGTDGNLTFEQLAQFEGNDGRPAYIAYNGKIYDVSHSKLWRNGKHAGRHYAGGDLTDMVKQAPHGDEKITALPEIGKLVVSGHAAGTSVHEKIFYFMAYFNLALVFLIVLVVALWKWW